MRGSTSFQVVDSSQQRRHLQPIRTHEPPTPFQPLPKPPFDARFPLPPSWADQIATRLLGSSCPPLYWHMGQLLLEGGRPARLLAAYLLLYNVLGPILHCNFLPWT